MATVFAIKSAWQIGLWEHWPAERRTAAIEFIKSFQDPDGWVRDPWVLNNSIQETTHFNLEDIIRAETRQTLSLMFALGKNPNYPVPLEFKTPNELKLFIESLDWRNPWGAGSHWSHQAFFLGIRRKMGIKDSPEFVETLIKCLSRKFCQETGTWFDLSSKPPEKSIQINGAMKVLSGLAWLQSETTDHSALVKYSSAALGKLNSCDLLNQLYVLNRASEKTRSAINNTSNSSSSIGLVGWRILIQSLLFYRWLEGAFSFYPTSSQTTYYGIPTSLGRWVADLHGTAMQTWAIGVALDFSGNLSRCSWQIQKV